MHQSGFLISPTMHLFPLSGQLGSCGVSIKVTVITPGNYLVVIAKYAW